MIDNSALETILTDGDDFAVVVELYAADAAPPFDPNDALFLYSSAAITFESFEYDRRVRSIGRIRRTITEETNSAEVTLSNLDNVVSSYELTTGHEGLIMVIRMISRAQSTLANSLILFTGRCERPDSGNRESMSISATQIISASDGEIPRRKYSYDDAAGRAPQDPNFEGFRFMPQYGVTTYSVRQRRGGLLGLFGLKKTVTKTLQYSSFSDLDADKYVPAAFGRVQLMLTHVAYADLGTTIRTSSAICDGPISDFVNWRTDDARFTLYGTIHKRFGFPANEGPVDNPGGIYTQQPIPNPTPPWIGNGFYSRTAMFFSQMLGTAVGEVDEAPGVIVVVLGYLMTVPDGSGDWVTTDTWSDNGAAQTRFVLTSDDYYKLDDAWINDESFYEAHQYNDEILFDASYSDLIFIPNTSSFGSGLSEKGRFLASTAHCTPAYFEYLAGGTTPSETFLYTPVIETYSDSVIPIDPPDPEDPDLPGGFTTNLTFFLRRRYTSNVVVSEQTRLADFLNKILFPASRMFLSQDSAGRLKLNHKKPVDWALATAAISGDTIALDNVAPFAADTSRYLLIDPGTSNAEIRVIDSVAYSSSTPSLSVTGDLTASAFSGTPKTATITVDAVSGGDLFVVTFDEAEFSFTAGGGDTVETVAGFLYGTINAHPIIKRRYSATWTPGGDTVTITYLSGTVTLTEAVENSHVAPLADPSTGPTLGSSGGTLGAGDYRVCYSYANARGETLVSPYTTVTVGADAKIDVSTVSLPSGASAIRWYCSPAANSVKLRFVAENNGSAFSITSLPLLSATPIPDFNRTGAEVMRVQAVFSDRAETSSSITRSNVLKASFKWKLGGRDKVINEVSLKYRDATQDFRLLDLRLKDDVHIAKIKKKNTLEINGQAIDSYNQAYRVAAGYLAERLDADFFYEWQSDRAALLLEEGDVVAITDAGSGVVNFPVRIESIEFDDDGGFVKASFTARKYSTTLYDDSVRERNIPVIVESSDTFAPLYAEP